MIFANLTLMFLYLNLSLNASDYNETGLMGIDYRDEFRTWYPYGKECIINNIPICSLFGWTTPIYPNKAVITIWFESWAYNPPIIWDSLITHELKHLRCWQQEGRKGYKENFLYHKGCFLNS